METKKQSEIFPPDFYNDGCISPAARATAEFATRKLNAAEDAGSYIAERLKEKKPEVYAFVRTLRGMGVPIKRVMNFANVAYDTVISVDIAERGFIAAVKERMAKGAYMGAQMALETFTEFLPKIANKKRLTMDELRGLADTFSKLVEKGNLLTGDVTERVETTPAGFTNAEDFIRKYYGEKAEDAEIVDKSERQINETSRKQVEVQ